MSEEKNGTPVRRAVDLAHKMRSELTSIRSNAQFHCDHGPQDDQLRASLKVIINAADEMNLLLGQLVEIAAGEER